MTISTQLMVWPTTAVTLREILNVDSGPNLKCHMQTQQKKRCTRQISKDNSARISDLLEQIALKGSLKAARAILTQLSQLILCGRNHRKDGPKFLLQWEKKLEDIEHPAIAIKKEDVEESQNKAIAFEKAITKEEVEDGSQGTSSTSIPEIKVEDEGIEDPEGESFQDISLLTVSTTSSRRSSLSSSTIPVPADSKALQKTGPQHVFERYDDSRTVRKRNDMIMELLLQDLKPSEKENGGKIYTYTFPNNYRDVHPLLKIGYTKNSEQRLRAWERQCGYTPKEISQHTSDHYVKAERLVHVHLHNFRKKETGGCPVCGVKHQEWFEVSETLASTTIALWARFMRLQPYDTEGKLTEDWKNRLEEVDLDKSDCWLLLVDGMEKAASYRGSDSSSLE